MQLPGVPPFRKIFFHEKLLVQCQTQKLKKCVASAYVPIVRSRTALAHPRGAAHDLTDFAFGKTNYAHPRGAAHELNRRHPTP